MTNQFPDATKMIPTLCDRIALVLCQAHPTCSAPCVRCRAMAAATAHEIADYFSERYGGASNTADTLYAVGCYQPESQAEGPVLSPDQEAMALAVGRELRSPNG
jgi:hypothetical protein